MEFVIAVLSLCVLVIFTKLEQTIKERDSAEERAIKHFNRSLVFEKSNKQYQEEHEILLQNASELREQLKNIEIIVNSEELTFDKIDSIKKELVDNLQTEN